MHDLKLLPEVEPDRPNLTDWAIRLGVGMIFTLIGLDKFPDNPSSEWVRIFHQIGWGDWFRYATGIVETAAGVAVIMPKFALAAYVVLACTMGSAALIHLFILHDGGLAIIPVVLFAVLTGLAYHRYTETS
ncbi:MAG TPA: DoxX family protein [Terriglobales bacterium]|nr:DoxX family protein [Terriglobales bacterium]